MSDDIAPALTPEEWHSLTSDHGACVDCYAHNYRLVRDDDDETPVSVERVTTPDDLTRHALAALALYGQPFGFTHDLLESLRIVEWEYSNHSSAPDAAKHAAALRTVAAIVASLLPPKP